MSTFAFIIALVAVVLLWLDSARAREMARALCVELCRRKDYQLLDDSVSLARMAPRATPRGLRLRRMYRFDYSIEGVQRRTGFVILVGTEFEHIDFGDNATEPPATQNDKVVPFRRKRR